MKCYSYEKNLKQNYNLNIFTQKQILNCYLMFVNVKDMIHIYYLFEVYNFYLAIYFVLILSSSKINFIYLLIFNVYYI